jgi:hypothetical protein
LPVGRDDKNAGHKKLLLLALEGAGLQMALPITEQTKAGLGQHRQGLFGLARIERNLSRALKQRPGSGVEGWI